MTAKPLATFRMPGRRLLVHGNRVELWRRSFFFYWRKTVIPVRNIANVDARQATGKLTIETTGGQKHTFPCGMRANCVQEAILEVLPTA